MRRILALILLSASCFAATVTARISTASTTGGLTSVSGAFTPAAGELLVAFVVATGTADTGAMSDTQNLGFAFAGSALKATSADRIYAFVAQRFAAASSMTVTFRCPNDASTGTVIFVAGISGMTRTGPGALRQLAVLSNQGASTPAISFAASALTGNPTLGVIGNATNPAGLTEPSGWAEPSDTGYGSPTTGAEYVSRDSGFTSTTITWGSSSSAWGGIIVEADTSAPPTSYVWPNCDSAHPCLIQEKTTTVGNEAGVNGFQLHYPNLTLSSNFLILTMQYDSNLTVTSIVNDVGGTWVQGPKISTGGNETTLDSWYIVNCPSGISKVTVTLSGNLSALLWATFKLAEWSGIATSSPIDGTSTSSDTSVGVIRPGSITTTQAGDIIYNAVGQNSQFSTPPTNETPLAAITPDNLGVLIQSNNWVQFADQFIYQSASGAINPAMYHDDPQGKEHTFYSIAMALKASNGAGTQPSAGIRIVRLMAYFGDATNVSFQFPTSGNLVVFETPNDATAYPITNLADSAGDTWNLVTRPQSGDPQIRYACNTTPSPTNMISYTQAGTHPFFEVWDVSGAIVSSSCLDGSAEANGTQGSAGADITNAPSYTPTTADGLIIVSCPYGIGPPSGSISAGAIFDSVFATGMTDNSTYDTGDGHQHYFNPNTTAINFGWHMSNPTATSWNSIAAGFKKAVAATSIPGQFPRAQ